MKLRTSKISMEIRPKTEKPRSWKPRLLPFVEAYSLSDYTEIKADLEYSKCCFERLSVAEYGILNPVRLGALSLDQSNIEDWCLLVSGAIYYRRCFMKSARGNRLCRYETADALDDEKAELHRQLIEVANRHIAHPVNNMDLHAATLHIAIDESGNVHRGGLGFQGARIAPFSASDYKIIISMVSVIIDKIIKPKISELQSSVQEKIDDMTDQEVLSLSEGFAPVVDEDNSLQRRIWPPQQKRKES